MQAVATHSQVAIEATPKKANPYAISQRYTGFVRQAILHARSEAINRGETVITVSDLLAGLCQMEDTRAERVGNLKTNALYLRWLCDLPQLPWSEPSAFFSEKPCELDAEAHRALAFAVAEADRDGQHWIDSDHLLRGLLRFPNRAQFAILKTELNLTLARQASFHDRDEYEPEEEPDLKMMDTLVSKYVPQLAPHLLSAVCYLYILLHSLDMGFQNFTR
ncbi:MAG TPA: hypothetical protein VL346_13385 [Acidobacteriaceae bacterium]|nr:hypothetical protein [Acidobacteriaceae bacterium]